MAGPSDGEDLLVRRALGGDAGALETLLAPHLASAARLARRMTRTRQDAQDVLQDACLRAIEQLDRFAPGRPFGPWFKKLLVNSALNRQKAEQVRETDALNDEIHHTSSNPQRDAEGEEFRRRFSAALETLPPRQRMIVLLFEVDGHTTGEIAEQLDISTDTVRWHLHAARTSLRTILKDFRPTSGPKEAP